MIFESSFLYQAQHTFTQELERPSPDPLQGQMLHCWVLVLAGKREILDNFFIDPLTGKSYGLGDESFLGVESLWNQHNYWVNMQDCSHGCSVRTAAPPNSPLSLVGMTLMECQMHSDGRHLHEPHVLVYPPVQPWVHNIYIYLYLYRYIYIFMYVLYCIPSLFKMQ